MRNIKAKKVIHKSFLNFTTFDLVLMYNGSWPYNQFSFD